MKVSNYKSINRNSLVAAFDLDLASGFKIAGAMLMEKDGRQWVSFPGIPYEKDGKKSYKPVLEIPDRDRRDKFSQQVIDALKEQGHL